MDQSRDNRIKKYEEKSLEKLEHKVVFKNNTSIAFIFKKSERISAALYLITDLITDKEPMKWALRNTAVEMMSDISSCLGTAVDTQAPIFNKVAQGLAKMRSLSKIAYLAGLISDMNFTVLSREFGVLLEAIEQAIGMPVAGAILTDDFFSTGMPNFAASATPTTSIAAGPLKGLQDQRPETYKGHLKDKESIKNNEGKKSDRRLIILNLLKKGNTLGIKDFSSEIKDCSEKTIQRELLALVAEGVLEKKGERRWSSYALKISQ